MHPLLSIIFYVMLCRKSSEEGEGAKNCIPVKVQIMKTTVYDSSEMLSYK